MIPACHGRRIITTDRVRHRMSSVDRIFTDRSAGNQEVTCSQVPLSGSQRQGMRSRRLNIQAKSHTGTLSAIFLIELVLITIHDPVEIYYQLLSLVRYKVLSSQVRPHAEVRRIRSGLKKGVFVEML